MIKINMCTLLLSMLMIFPAYCFQPISITLDETKNFPGDWSLLPEEIYLALKYTTYSDTLHILEFGAGSGTVELTKLLQKKQIAYNYHAFENDAHYATKLDNVTYHLYQLPRAITPTYAEWSEPIANIVFPVEFPTFDLIIVDGPHGVARSEWYRKFKQYARPGTIILVDDFAHYTEFAQQLDEHFKYTTIIEYNQSSSWPIINEGIETITSPFLNKTFKIVIVNEVLMEENK